MLSHYNGGQPNVRTNPPDTRRHPSTVAKKTSLNGNDTTFGGSIIMGGNPKPLLFCGIGRKGFLAEKEIDGCTSIILRLMSLVILSPEHVNNSGAFSSSTCPILSFKALISSANYVSIRNLEMEIFTNPNSDNKNEMLYMDRLEDQPG